MSLRRIDELLSSLGYCSRKEAPHWCTSGRVKMANGESTQAKLRVEASAVRVDGQPLEFPDGLLVMLHKPLGYVCSHDSREGPRVYDLLPPRWLKRNPAITSVGRLDKDTSGLLLLTDMGPLVQRWTSPKHHVFKTYIATLNATPTPEAFNALSEGVELREGAETWITRPAKVRALGTAEVEISLSEGKYHQVRRMFSAVGLEVLQLHRTHFGEWNLGELPVGQFRVLTLALQEEG